MGYALAAGAAGVGLVVTTQPARADIVYTPAHGLPDLVLNHNGIVNFGFRMGFATTPDAFFR